MTTYTIVRPGEEAPGPITYTLQRPPSDTGPDDWVRAASSATGIPENSALLQGSLPLLHRLARQGGLAARYALEGAGGLAGIVTDPLWRFAGSDKGVAQRTSEALTRAGLPAPETPLERGVGDVSRALTQAAVTGGASTAAAVPSAVAARFASSPAAVRVVNALNQRFGLQAASAAGAGGAGAAAREGTPFSPPVGPMGQFIASLVGGLATPMVTPLVTPRITAGGLGFKTPQTLSDIWRGAKGVVEPFREGGTENVVGGFLNRVAPNREDAIAALNNAPEYIHGSHPTAAEAYPPFGPVEAAVAAKPEGAILKARHPQQVEAATRALRPIAGDPADRAAWVQARKDVSEPLYEQAFAEIPTATPWIKGQISQLQKRPAFQEAFKQAQIDALNNGLKLDPSNAVQVAHYTKIALGGMINEAKAKGNVPPGYQDTLNKLVTLMESKDFSPPYETARTTYADMSKPINQIDVGQALLDKLLPGLSDFGGTSRLRSEAYANALRNADATAAKATDFAGAKMADILGPEQMGTVTDIARDLARSANAADAGRSIGSNTTDKLSMQNAIAQAFGSTNANNPLARVLNYPVSKIYEWGGVDQAAAEMLARALRDPEFAAQLMRDAPMSRAAQTLSEIFSRGLAPTAAGTAAGINQIRSAPAGPE
jgi:hypothetical protein